MTMDKSLRVRAGMIRARNVLTRDERIQRLIGADRWKEEENSPLGLPKVRVFKLSMKKKKKKKKEDEEGAEAEGGAAKAPAGKAPAGKAPAAKGAGKK
jgi:small basic protein (TIGR04137 family)